MGFRVPRMPRRVRAPGRHRAGETRATRSRGLAAAVPAPPSPTEWDRMARGETVRGLRLSGPTGQAHRAGTREQLSARPGAHRTPNPRQTPLTDRPDPYGALRGHYSTPQGRGRKPTTTAKTARGELEARAKRTDARGRVAHPEYLGPAKGRAARPAATLPGDPTPVARGRTKAVTARPAAKPVPAQRRHAAADNTGRVFFGR